MTGSAPVASIIVPTFRGVDRLPTLFDAFASQQEGTESFEVIVVIDGVDDGSVALAAKETRFAVRHILFPENRGRVAALNAGFEAARGDVLVRCDDDLVPQTDYVHQHVRSQAHGPVGAIGLYLNRFEPTAYSHAYGEQADRDLRAGAYMTPTDMRWRFWAGNCSITRAVWATVGPYDPDYRLYGWEDIDYGYRVQRAGFPVILHRGLETPHRVAAVTTQIRAVRAAHAASARRIFERKHQTANLPPAVPPHSVWNTAVRGVSVAARLAGTARVGAIVDRMLPVAPPPVARKLIALAVEGSALAGYSAPATSKEVF
jgi:glycosyltransferase involved in cell wall biosynthesis